MKKQKRIEQILELLNKNGELTVEEACKKLSVSPATIRRDFSLLSEKKAVTKSWGGIILLSGYPVLDSMTPLSQRKTEFLLEKKVIAEKAASFVKNGDIIMIDGGTTTLEMIPFLAHLRLKIITNSILIAQHIDNLSKKHDLEVFLTGGMLYPSSGLLVSTQASESLEKYHAKWLFLSTGGVSKKGISNSNILVVETERSMIKQSENVVILADHSKIGKNDLVKLCDLKDIDILITNETQESRQILEKMQLDKKKTFFV